MILANQTHRLRLSGHGIAQTIEFGLGSLLASGDELVQILADWAEERYPLYAYHPSRICRQPKVRAFLDFVVASIPPTSKKKSGSSARKSLQGQGQRGRIQPHESGLGH